MSILDLRIGVGEIGFGIQTLSKLHILYTL